MLAQLVIGIFTVFCLINPNLSDIYLHNPRGSNNRHNEQTRELREPKLSFDSQNNARGGYNVGDDGTMYFYTGSILPVEWTNQHSCNDVNADCTLILQYTCADHLRDGKLPVLIPETVEGEANETYRLTETFSSYLNCRTRSRNKNLFTASQTLRENSSIYTRQNPNGERYGYECPEERDYYPYWQPTMWKDIAILTNRVDLCDYYRINSENVQGRSTCLFENKNDLIRANELGVVLPITKEECESFNSSRFNLPKAQWRSFPSHNIPPPSCQKALYSRENHLGDSPSSEMMTFNWTIPKRTEKKCLFRIRYNISTSDYDAWKTDASANQQNLFVMENFFPNRSVALSRGYRFEKNPKIQLFPDLDFKLQLAIDVTDFGRVFQDRSFTFEIRDRPSDFQDRPIFNLNVRGRRGNIVQVYPAVEYDFVPNRLEIPKNSYVHIQWIGSNTTPDGAGQGDRSIDRNNLLLLNKNSINESWKPFEYLNYSGLLLGNYPEFVNESNFLGFSASQLKLLAASGNYSDANLYGASAYFDLGAQRVPEGVTGIFHYVSTRNNDFSNRDQKGRILVQPFSFSYQSVGNEPLTIQVDDILMNIPENSFNGSVTIKLTRLSKEQLAEIVPVNGKNLASKVKLFDDVIVVEPHDIKFLKNFRIEIPMSHFDDFDSIENFQFEPNKGVFMKISPSLSNDGRKLVIEADRTGVYAFSVKENSSIWIAGLVIGLVLGLIVIVSTIVYFRLSPTRYSRVKDQVNRTKRSLFSKV